MTTVLVVFAVALALSLMITPLAGKLGMRYGAVDTPDERKVHTRLIPRTGGLAIFITFFVTLLINGELQTLVSVQIEIDQHFFYFFGGAFIIFGIGLADDFRRLHPGIKFVFQIIAASFAYMGNLGFDMFSLNIQSAVFSYIATVAWFVLFINAVNLIDGLDGLAGGIVFFVSVVIVMLSILRDNYVCALLFAVLAGSVLGFLRYNFNPASVFMGDGGSYFLGYIIAGSAIIGNAKNQVGAAMLIPLLALGVPLFDTLLAPLRRFLKGRQLFQPDNDHIHHKLLNMGISDKNVVWLLYTLTFCLCLFAIVMVNYQDERSGLFLIVLGAGAIIFVRKLGYFEYFGSDKIYGWFKDLTDDTGITYERRSFLNLQMEISQSDDIQSLWLNMIKALERLKFDRAELNLKAGIFDPKTGRRSDENRFLWTRNGFYNGKNIFNKSDMKLELPLLTDAPSELKTDSYGILVLVKDLKRDPITHYTLRRVEHLRRTIMSTLKRLDYRNSE
ncbi:MraY family glycosyltransferase [Desulfococcaceae bacterium HSG9]|nr:MraY family glycosyltransferase [Desulfococcaceae bacterium HSG9]